MNRSELKNKAKESLKGKYGDAIALLLIPYGIVFVLGFIIGFSGLDEKTAESVVSSLSVVVSSLLGFGTISYFLKLSRNESVTYRELFSKKNMAGSFIAISLLVGLFTTLWSFLFIIPGIIAALNYSLVYYIKLDNPNLSSMEVISKSKEMMRGHKWDFCVLMLSFIGWEILGIFTLGILYLWLVPYMQVTYANFYNSIKNEKSNL